MLLGRQEPTFWHRPAAVSNAAVECLEFYDQFGPPLDPWQRTVIEIGLGEDDQGYWASPEVALEAQRQNGKGNVTEAVELTGLFVWGEKLITHTAHLIDTSKTAFKRAVDLVDNADDLRRRVKRVNKTIGEEAIELLDGASLRFRTRTGRAGRGISGQRITFDEAQELTPDQMDAMVPTILAQDNPQVWYTFTIPKTSAQFVSHLRKRAQAGEAGLAYAEWANQRGADLNDQRVLARVNPAYGRRVTPRTLAIARGALGEDGFARECGGIWPPEGVGDWLVIPESAWSDLEDAESAPVDPVAFAADATPSLSHGAIAVAGWRADGLAHVEVIESKPGTAWIPARLAELRDRWRPCAVVIDAKRQASQYAPKLAEAGIDVHLTTAREYAQACGRFYTLVTETKELRHRGANSPTGSALTDALSAADKRDLEGAWAWDGRTDVNIAPLVAATQALMGLERYGSNGGPNLW